MKIDGIELDIEYTATVEFDAVETNSPTNVEHDVDEVMHGGVNIFPIMSEAALLEIDAKIISDELEEARGE